MIERDGGVDTREKFSLYQYFDTKLLKLAARIERQRNSGACLPRFAPLNAGYGLVEAVVNDIRLPVNGGFVLKPRAVCGGECPQRPTNKRTPGAFGKTWSVL
jgi:hypothetical protein